MSDINKLSQYIIRQPPLAIAVSGGVDSLTLAYTANLVRPETTAMFHAVSPAVPPEATQLVQHYANNYNWNLQTIDAQEYHDPRYRRNPVDRCYFCKTNLYSRIKDVTDLTIASGTNLDDLGDYRPGLKAADQHGVIHPYVDVSINKSGIRKLATELGLHTVAKLPAQPCLASRVETGIRIDANDLAFINSMECMIRDQLGNGDIRCRLTAKGVKLEIESKLLSGPQSVADVRKARIEHMAKQLCESHSRSFIGLAPYKQGSAFIHPVTRISSQV